MVVKKVDLEELKEQRGNLSEEQVADIAAEADEEYNLEQMTPEEREEYAQKKKESEDKEEQETQEKEDQRILDTDEDNLNDDDKDRRKELIEAQEKEEEERKKEEAKEEEERILGTEESELSEEDKEKKKTILADKEEAEKREGLQKEFDSEEVKGYMEKEKLSEEEAKTKIAEKNKSIIEKYGGDQHKLASGYRNLQSEASKTQNELKKTQAQLQNVQDQNKNASLQRKWTVDEVKQKISHGELLDEKGNPMLEGDVIEGTKKSYPSITKDMDDDGILEFASDKILQAYHKAQDSSIREQSEKASERRTELLANLPEDMSEFKGEIEQVLSKTPDTQVLRADFDLEDLSRWSKGGKYDELKATTVQREKDAYDRGLKKGQEDAKVLGAKADPTAGRSGSPKKGTTGLSRDLTKEEESRARDMFEQLGIEKDMFEAYIDVYPDGEPGVNTNAKKKEDK